MLVGEGITAAPWPEGGSCSRTRTLCSKCLCPSFQRPGVNGQSMVRVASGFVYVKISCKLLPLDHFALFV